MDQGQIFNRLSILDFKAYFSTLTSRSSKGLTRLRQKVCFTEYPETENAKRISKENKFQIPLNQFFPTKIC